MLPGLIDAHTHITSEPLWITDAYFERYKSWGIPEDPHRKISAFIPLTVKNVERAIHMGVKIATGTDAGVGEHALSAKDGRRRSAAKHPGARAGAIRDEGRPRLPRKAVDCCPSQRGARVRGAGQSLRGGSPSRPSLSGMAEVGTLKQEIAT